jgi:hypothetical protein
MEDYENYRIAAYFVVTMFGAAVNSKVLGASIVAALAYVALAGNVAGANFVFFFYLAAVLLASFRPE